MRFSSPCVLSSATAPRRSRHDRSGRRPSPSENDTSWRDLADLAEVRVGEALLMVRQAISLYDRPPRETIGDAARGHRNVTEQHAGVDREVVDACSLLDERVAIDVPGEIFDACRPSRAPDRWVRCQSARRVVWMITRVVDVLAGRQVHHRVGAPQRRHAASRLPPRSTTTRQLPILALIFTKKFRR